MNQLACPTDISSGVGDCAKMHLKMGVAGPRSKVGRPVGVNTMPIGRNKAKKMRIFVGERKTLR